MTVGELVDLIQSRYRHPRATEVQVAPQSVRFTVGDKRYIATTDQCVREVKTTATGVYVCWSLHSQYAEGVLQGGQRDAMGRLIDG